ncbi:MAG: FG-GAP repeat domain-containing protein, partial [Flavobacteriales bacterium]
MLPLLMVFALQPKARPQVAFVDVSDEVNVYSDHTNGYWGTGLSTVDFNGDGYDDITLAHHAGELRFYLGNGTGFEEIAIDLPDYPFEAKAPIWADIDNDGDQDLFVTYRLAANKLYRNNGNLEFIDISQTSGINQASYRSYGACFGDFDKDGLLDLFVANYAFGQDPPVNELYKNLGDGLFLDVGSDFVIGEPVTHSFQGQWVDFNEDDLLDLHLIRDRIDFENRYYKQQEDGSFIEDSHDMGLDL